MLVGLMGVLIGIGRYLETYHFHVVAGLKGNHQFVLVVEDELRGGNGEVAGGNYRSWNGSLAGNILGR